MTKIKFFIVFVILFSLVSCGENGKIGNSNPQPIRVSAPQVDAAEPAIAATNDGVFVVWVEHGADKAADVFLQKHAFAGKPLGEKLRINPNAGQATAWRGDQPTIFADKNNAVFIVWTARAGSAEQRGNDLFLSVSRDSGKSFVPPVKINDDKTPSDKGMHSLAVDKNGNVFVAWLDERYLQNQTAQTQNQFLPDNFQYEKAHHDKDHKTKPAEHGEANREVYFSVSKDGGKTFSANKKLAGDACPCCKTSLAVAPDGRIYAGWRQVLPDEFRHIAVASSIDGGENFSAPVIVSDDKWQIKGCPVSGAALNVGANNALGVFWFSAGEADKTGVYSSESNDGGKTFAPRKLISAGGAFGTPVLLANEAESFKFVWNAGDKILAANSTNAAEIQDFGRGELPAAAFAGKRLVTAFIRKENDKRGVWLAIGN